MPEKIVTFIQRSRRCRRLVVAVGCVATLPPLISFAIYASIAVLGFSAYGVANLKSESGLRLTSSLLLFALHLLAVLVQTRVFLVAHPVSRLVWGACAAVFVAFGAFAMHDLLVAAPGFAVLGSLSIVHCIYVAFLITMNGQWPNQAREPTLATQLQR